MPEPVRAEVSMVGWDGCGWCKCGGQVGFVAGDEEGAGGEGGGGGFVFGVGGAVASMTRRTMSASAMASRDLADADGFGFVGGLAKAGCINEFDGDAVEGDASR